MIESGVVPAEQLITIGDLDISIQSVGQYDAFLDTLERPDHARTDKEVFTIVRDTWVIVALGRDELRAFENLKLGLTRSLDGKLELQIIAVVTL